MSAQPPTQPATQPPTWWASLAVRTAALPLPSEHRYRYRQEFLAELYGLPPSAQFQHASGVLSHVVTLRLALTDPDRQLAKEAAMRKRLRCRLRWHRWNIEKDWQGKPYRVCRDCGAVSTASIPMPPGGGGPMGGGV